VPASDALPSGHLSIPRLPPDIENDNAVLDPPRPIYHGRQYQITFNFHSGPNSLFHRVAARGTPNLLLATGSPVRVFRSGKAVMAAKGKASLYAPPRPPPL